MTWSTFYGGNYFDVEPCFDIDNNGNMCIVFTTTSTDIPVFSSLTGSYTQSFSGAVDIGFTLFNQSGQKIMHSYLGGTSDDFVEDLISTGKSSLQAVEALRNAGCEVLGMVAIFTYGFDVAKQNFAKQNVPLYTLASYDDLITQATEQNLISPHQHRTLLEWRKDPGNWKK